MNRKRLVFSAMGPLSDLPDSQTVFGALCYLYRDVYGSDQLESLLGSLEKGNQQLITSSMFLHDSLPMPLNIEPYFIRLDQLNDDQFPLLKKTKKIRFISRSLFNAFQKDHETFNKDFYNHIFTNHYHLIPEHRLLIHKDEKEAFESYHKIESLMIRNQMGYLEDKQLFYTVQVRYSEHTRFNVYIDATEYLLEQIIHAFQKVKHVSIGGKKSIGMNLFEYQGVEDVEIIEHASHKILLSKAVFNQEIIDFSTSFYKISVINPRHANENQEQLFKNKMILFEEGSAFSFQKSHMGKLIRQDFNEKHIYHQATGFLV